MNEILTELYYDPNQGYIGADALVRKAIKKQIL